MKTQILTLKQQMKIQKENFSDILFSCIEF